MGSTLDKVAGKGLLGVVILSREFLVTRVPAMCRFGTRLFQAEGTSGANVLRLELGWHFKEQKKTNLV